MVLRMLFDRDGSIDYHSESATATGSETRDVVIDSSAIAFPGTRGATRFDVGTNTIA